MTIILSADNDWAIGKDGGLVTDIPEDMKFFRETTKGHTVAMGENTLISFPNSKPLKNRTNIVLSQDDKHNYEEVMNVHSMDDFKMEIKKQLENDDVFIIGGASIYRQMLPYVDEVLLTKVNEDGHAEVFFPNIDQDPSFELLSSSEIMEDNDHQIRFCTYKNNGKTPL